MTDNMTLDGPARDLQALLPWYLNGTVSAAERAAIEAWLEEDADARLLLDAMRDEQEIAIAANAEIEVPAADRGLAALMAAIGETQTAAAPPRRAPAARRGLMERLAGWLPTPGLRLTAGLASVLVVVQAVAIAVMLGSGPGSSEDPRAPGFQTASDGGAGLGPRFLMSFPAAMTIGELSALLDEHALRIVDSPAGEIYEVEYTGEAADEVAVQAVETGLRADTRIQLIGRSD